MIFICVFSMTGCATIFSGNTDKVTITSSPSEATVTINGVPRGTTPLMLELDKGSSYNVEIKKEGYETKHATIANKVGAGWVVLDVFTGLVPLVVDIITDAWYKLTPTEVHVNL